MRWLLLPLLLTLSGGPALAGALTSYQNLPTSMKSQISNDGIFVKGNADTNWYALEVDPATGALPVSGTITATNPSVSATGAAVPANATYVGMTVSGNLTGLVGTANGLKVDGSAVTQPVSGTFWQATQPVSGTVTVNPLTNSSVVKAQLQDNAGNAFDEGSGVSTTTTLRTIPAGRDSTKTTLARNNYSSTNVTTGAYVQLIASTGNAINRLCIFDSSGSAIKVATGAAASEVDRLYIPPGGLPQCYEINIPASTRISLEALDVNATQGQLILTGLP